MGLHVARYFRQGVAEFATDQTGVWADLVVACGGRASRVPVRRVSLVTPRIWATSSALRSGRRATSGSPVLCEGDPLPVGDGRRTEAKRGIRAVMFR